MKIFRYIAILAILISTVSCIQTDVDIPVTNGKTIQIIGHVQSFSDRNVDSRALKVGDESNVAALCLVVFNNNNVCTRKEYQPGNPTFTLTTDDLKDGYTLCMFANIPDPTLGAGNTLDEFKRIACPVTTVDMPELNGTKCFPMYGEKTIGGSLDAVIQIPLTSLYAKVVVNIISKPDQTVVGHTPASFSLSKYEVHNVAESVDFVGGTISNKGVGGSNDGTAVSKVVYTARNITSDFAQANNQASFFFYLPERFLCPNKNVEEYKYPFGRIADLDEDEARRYPQCYKPKYAEDCCGKNVATFVRFYGEYIDHQGHNWNVSYDIYVGNDNYSNFDIERNIQYNNYVTIKGISKSSDQNENTISIDHRVNVERVSPVFINLRRETLLDSHYEVRPLRIRKNPNATGNYDGAKIKVEVVFADNDEAKTNDAKRWIGIERSFGNGVTQTASNNTYLVDSDLATNRKNSAGKRKYFTTDLTTTTLAGNKTIEVPISDTDETVWIYVDECTEAGDDVRSAKIKLTMLLNGAEIGTTEYHINQRKLFPITYNGRTYHIEYHEEYLHNYDAEDQYGQTEYEGMQWGLDGVQLSTVHNSFYINETNSSWTSFLNNSTEYKPKYDFYIAKHDSEIVTNAGVSARDYAGQEFTSEIYQKSNTGENAQKDERVKILTLGDQARGAVEYCYNRNKRNADGSITSVEWYLPSTDQMEEIAVAAYSRFSEFQDNYYWTSQPAFIRNVFYFELIESSGFLGLQTKKTIYAFTVYDDNPSCARATKVVYSDGEYSYVASGLKDKPDNFSSIDDTKTYNSSCLHFENKCFNEMYRWKKPRSGDYNYDVGWRNWNDFGGDEEFNDTRDNKRYHVHLGHDWNELKQDGYHERTRYNRVRCLRKNNEPFVNATFNR